MTSKVSEKSSGLSILEFKAENVKRLSVVEITSAGDPVVVIAGENEAGKSSVLDAIAMALGGKDQQPQRPIRDGQSKASVRLDLGDFIVTRTFTQGGGSLIVTNRDGLKYPSPQALLDGLVGKLTFDPLAFATLDAKQQAQTLRNLAGLDTTDLDLKRKTAFDARSEHTRELKNLEGAKSQAITYPEVGTQEVSASEAIDALAKADALATAAAARQRIVYERQSALTSAEERFRRDEKAVDDLRLALEKAEDAVMVSGEVLAEARTQTDEAINAFDAASRMVPDRTALQQQVRDAEAINAKVRMNQQAASLSTQITKKTTEISDLTARINSIDVEKAEQLEKAPFPVKGLGIDDSGVTWQGLPFEQASTAVRVRVSVAIGMALNPKLRVCLVRNGNDLDAKNFDLLVGAAQAAGVQLWIEKIAGATGQHTIIIEDGRVAGK